MDLKLMCFLVELLLIFYYPEDPHFPDDFLKKFYLKIGNAKLDFLKNTGGILQKKQDNLSFDVQIQILDSDLQLEKPSIILDSKK